MMKYDEHGGIAGRALMTRCGAALSLALLIAGCAHGHYPDLPATADYGQSCDQLIDGYVRADARFVNRRSLSVATDLSIAAGTVVAVAASVSTAGASVAIGGALLSRAKGDLGAAKRRSERDMFRDLAIRKGCSMGDVEERQAELDREPPAPPAASSSGSRLAHTR